MSFLTPVRNYVDALVHPTAAHDALTAARHRAFIAPRLIGSFVALASFPAYVVFRGVPSVLEVGVFAWLVAPILIAYFLSRTGRYESAHVLSSLALTGLVAVVAWCTGGIGSFAAIWLVVVPLEAALSASRRVVALASTFALAAAGLLLAMSAAGVLPPATTLAQRTRRARRAWDHFGRALCHRTGARRRIPCANQLLAALRRGRPLPPARAQYDRRDRSLRPQRLRVCSFHPRPNRCSVRAPASSRATAYSTVCMWPIDRPISRRLPTQRRTPKSARSNSAFAATIPHQRWPFRVGRNALPSPRPGERCSRCRT